MSSNIPPYVTFHDGNKAPQLGFGVWQIETDAEAVIKTAIDVGYRLIDTAAIYGNEASVGDAIKNCGIDRDQLFITTKLWNDRHGYDETMAAFDESLEKLKLDYVDMYLIHWPVPKTDLYVKSWEAMIQLHDEGRIKSLGVANFNINHLQRLLDETGVIPVVNQIELNPRFQQAELRDYHDDQGIVTQAWSPLGHGALWDNPVLTQIAHKHQRSVAQVILRWHIQLNNIVIPKSITPSRIKENFNVYDFALDDEDMAAIAVLDDPGARHGPDPERFRLPKA
ncbi:MAG TPA: aldo/keto reductase [Eoetvoesiella sp.]